MWHLQKWPMCSSCSHDIQWGAAFHSVTWSFNHVVLWGHMTNNIRYISSCRRTVNTKLGKVVIYREKLPPLNVWSHDHPLIRWPMWDQVANRKYLSLHFHKTYGHQAWQGACFREEVQKANALSHHDVLFEMFLLVRCFY